MINRLASLLLISLILLNAGDAVAQEPSSPRWRLGPIFSYESVTDHPAWQMIGVQVHHQGKGRNAVAELQRISRFSTTDHAILANLYPELWEGAYVNLRLHASPAPAFLPRADLGFELFQAVPGNWELSGGYRSMWFREEQVHLFSGSAGHYAGEWYLRGRTMLVPHHGELGLVFLASVRRFFLPVPYNLAELLVAYGREVVTVAAGPVIELRPVRSAALRMQRQVVDPIVLNLVLSYTDDQVFTRWGLTGGILLSW